MATSSSAAARRTLRPHTTTNVRENLRRERERLLARQERLEELAAPINEVAGQLAKLDALHHSKAKAAEKRIEQLEKARDKRLEKIRVEFEAKIDAARVEASQSDDSLTPEDQTREDALLLDYARAIVAFGDAASVADLASVLGVSVREAKKLAGQAKADVQTADAAATGPSEPASATVGEQPSAAPAGIAS